MNQSQFFQQTMQFTRLFRKRLNEEINKVGLYYSQWSIVYFLKQNGSATLVEISEHLTVEKPTVTRTVKRLEEHRVIEEVPTEDKREKRIQLSTKGHETYEKAYEIVVKFEKSLMKEIEQEDIETTYRTIQRFKNKLL